jgi:hypothetical protein
MFELRIQKSLLLDLIKKIAIPYGKDKFVFDKIAPNFFPDGRLEWVAKNKNVTVWIRARNLTVSGITETMRIPFVTKELIGTLDFFENDAIVTIAHDSEKDLDRFESAQSSTELPSIPFENIGGMQSAFPAKIDSDGVIIFKDGIKPNLHANCPAKIFHESINNTYKVMGSKKKDEIPNIYHMEFDADHQFLWTIAGDETDKSHQVVRKKYPLDSVVGNGVVHYAQGFQEVMEALDGELFVSAVVGGPL